MARLSNRGLLFHAMRVLFPTWAVTLEGVAVSSGGDFMIITGLIVAVCLGVASVVFFIWRDKQVG